MRRILTRCFAVQCCAHFGPTYRQVTKVPLFPTGSLEAGAAHTVAVVKDTEPQFAGTSVRPNYITFHGFSGDEDGAARIVTPPPQAPQHRLEFLGDSISAGFDNQCAATFAIPTGFGQFLARLSLSAPPSPTHARTYQAGVCVCVACLSEGTLSHERLGLRAIPTRAPPSQRTMI